MFNYLDYKNKIPLDKCLIDIPNINPLSINYEKFWIHTVKRKQIEGHWVEHNGEYKWLPGPVFHYCNLGRIERKATGGSKGKVIGKPDLRDLEWIKGYVHAVARGFSGFEGDNEYSCHRILNNPDREELIPFLPKRIQDSLYTKDNKLKEYTDPLPYLYKYYNRNLGKPYYYNEAKNILEIGARNYGKSLWSANICIHNFLTDGATDFDIWYTEYKKSNTDPTKQVFTTQTLVGAIDAKYVNNLTKHIKIGLDNIPGARQVGDTLYPPPLSKTTMGSWTVGKETIAKYKIKIGGKWEWRGTGSSFAMRSFNDNPYAANGLRYGLGLIDEVGFHYNLLDTLGQLHECTTVDGEKYGSIWMAGTGGDMVSGATEQSMKVFYDGDAFDCISFDDIFENKGRIGLFIPAWMTLSEYRDELGNINKELAMKKLLKEREVAANAKTKDALYSLLQMKPLVPSEAFLVLEGNIFPIGELKEHMAELESNDRLKDLGNTGYMARDAEGKAYFKVDHTAIPADYPTKDGSDGCVVIWEEPIDNPSYGTYILGLDSYDQDKAENSVSFGSCIVYKRFVSSNQTYNIPVAEYTARPDFANDFYEQCRRLAEYYNGKILYENQNPGIKKYFETKYCTHLLHTQPNIIRSISPNSNVQRGYGIHMTKPIKAELEIMVRDWLKEETEPGIMQLTKILSIPLLKELIAYDGERNTDRFIAFALCILQDVEMFRIKVEEKKEIKRDNFFDRRLFI